MTTVLPPDVVDVILRLESQTCLRQVEWHAELSSTNDYALAQASDRELPLPRLIWAERQTAGRGRGHHVWWSSAGALTFSLLLDGPAMGLPQSTWPQLSMVTAIAVAEALRQFLPVEQVALKWPNDVHLLAEPNYRLGEGASEVRGDVRVASRKLCGILVEPAVSMPGRVVIGVGLNVRNSLATAPAEVSQEAISLAEVLPDPPPVPLLLWSFVLAWEQVVKSLAAGELDLVARWSHQCLLQGRPVELHLMNRVVRGLCRGVNAEGALVLECEGQRELFWAGTVRTI